MAERGRIPDRRWNGDRTQRVPCCAQRSSHPVRSGLDFNSLGYLLNRGAEVGRGSQLAYWTSMLAVAVLFGYGHWYKGPAAILDSGTAGLVLGSAYLLSRRNLWVPVLAHGLIDTAVVVATFLGWAN